MTRAARIPRALAAGAILLAAALAAAPAAAAPLVADLSQHLIKITTGFTGTDVLLFGTTDGIGDVIVVVRGPSVRTTVRRKHQIAGIWINRAQVTFDDAPSFYMVAASKPIRDILGQAARRRHQIGGRAIRLTPDRDMRGPVLDAYRGALRRNREDRKLFQFEAGRVRFLGERLFRADITFPANVPTGTYTVQVFLVRDGAVVTAQTTPLKVEKQGFEAAVYDFAHDNSAWYGLFAIILALAAGWGAGVIFRRN